MELFKEFNEEKFKKDTDTTELTNLEVVKEAIATLQTAYFREDEGFRRIEKVSLLAIYFLQEEIKELKKQLKEIDYTSIYLKGCADTKDKYKTQQEEFIKYLADDIKEREKLIVTYHPSTQLLIEQIIKSEKKVLSKYKRIIGETKND